MAELIKQNEWDLERIRNVLVIASRPGDELLGCGGSIRYLRECGKDVSVLFLSDYGGKDTSEVWIDKVTMVKDMLGYNHAEFWKYPGNRLKEYKESIEQRLTDFLLQKCIDLILCPAVFDFHEDNRAIGEVCTNLHIKLYPKKFAFYSVYSYIPGNFSIDISSYVDTIVQALRIYSEYSALISNAETFYLSVRKFNGFIFGQNAKYYESFILLEDNWDLSEIVQYVMGDTFVRGQEFYKYSEVKHIYHVIGYARYLEDELSKRDTEIAKLHKEKFELWKQCEEEKLKYKEQIRELYAIKASKFYKLMLLYHKLKDKLLSKLPL